MKRWDCFKGHWKSKIEKNCQVDRENRSLRVEKAWMIVLERLGK